MLMFIHLLQKDLFQVKKYDMQYDVHPNVGWNKDTTPTFSTYFNSRTDCKLALTLEVTHYGTDDNKVTAERLNFYERVKFQVILTEEH